MEVFFLCTAPALAGHFEQAFFQGSVLQLSLAEPAIRQAIAALGSLHERISMDKTQYMRRKNFQPELPIKLYNEAIRSIIEKVASETNDLYLLAVVNILFICFEYFQGNLEAAAFHIKGGIDIINNWRARNPKKLRRNHGQRYASLEAEFMETEVAPLLCTLNINAVQWGVGMEASLVLEPATDSSGIFIPGQFESLKAARVALLKLVIFATWQFEPCETEPSNVEFPAVCKIVMSSLARWKFSFDELCRRQWDLWDSQKRRTADALSIMHCNAEIGVYSYQAQNDCDLHKYRSQYEQTTRRINEITNDSTHSPHDLSKTFSLDFRMVFPLQPGAWTCRWPHLHRVALDLRARLPILKELPKSTQYHSIPARISEIEEAYQKVLEARWRIGDCEYQEILRIEDYSVAISQGEQGRPPFFIVTFWSKPDGIDGPWYAFTENMDLGPDRPANAACPEDPPRESIETCEASKSTSQILMGEPKPRPPTLDEAAVYERKHMPDPIKEETPDKS